jgi:hypothetical protein
MSFRHYLAIVGLGFMVIAAPAIGLAAVWHPFGGVGVLMLGLGLLCISVAALVTPAE